MKVILTNHNFYRDTNVRFLSYFSTSFNQGVAPGDFIWAPGTVADSLSAQNAPWRSYQIFSDYLDDESMLDAFEEIPGTSLTTAVYSVTTLENRAFGVKAGQKVEILLLQINSEIPTSVLLKSEIPAWTEAMAALVFDIASSQELVTRIASFLDD